jgi:hypothetical protein
MDSRAAIKATMDMGLMVLNTYVSDLSDTELLRRPAPGCNHLAWQLGHLISSEVSLLNAICPGKAAALPEGFSERHSRDNCASDDSSQFDPTQSYTELFARVRAATLAALSQVSDAELDAPSPDGIRKRFPTAGHVFALIAGHPLMHAGQFAVVRRQLGKPVLI